MAIVAKARNYFQGLLVSSSLASHLCYFSVILNHSLFAVLPFSLLILLPPPPIVQSYMGHSGKLIVLTVYKLDGHRHRFLIPSFRAILRLIKCASGICSLSLAASRSLSLHLQKMQRPLPLPRPLPLSLQPTAIQAPSL